MLLLLMALNSVVAAQERIDLKGNYLGQHPPSDTPVVFAPGTVSMEGKNSHALQFSPDGKMVIFSRYPDRTSYVVRRRPNGWSSPEQTSFTGKEVTFDAKSKRIFYYDRGGDLFWVRYSDDGFSEPSKLNGAINTKEVEYFPSITSGGNLFFSRNSKWDQGRIMVSKPMGEDFNAPVDLGDLVNTGGASHGFVAPDESYLLFNSPRVGSYTKNDIWVSFRGKDGDWLKPVNLGPEINSDARAVLCPTVSPDGKYLFFTRLQESGTGYIYWVSTRIIEELRIRPLVNTEDASLPQYSLSFSTFFGQHDPRSGLGVFTDGKGFVYVSGTTRDPNFPTTRGAFQTKLKGKADAFVAKFLPDGHLVYSTLIGGSKREHHVDITVDTRGAVYLVGGTHSADFPTTAKAYDVTFNGEKDWGGDVYVLKLDPTGSRLLFSTYIGGSAQETSTSILLDRKGDILIGGTTLSSDFPTTKGAFDRSFRGFDAFVAKLSADGRRLIFSTFFGGSEFDNIAKLALDEAQNIYLTGNTRSPDLPVTTDASQRGFGGGQSKWDGDGFLAKLSPDGARLLHATYLGGTGNDFVTSVVVGGDKRIYLTGSTTSSNFTVLTGAPVTESPAQENAFVTVLAGAKLKPVFATILGGGGKDTARNVFSIGGGRIVVGGETDSPDFPGEIASAGDKQKGIKRLFISVLDWQAAGTLHSMLFADGASYAAMHASEAGDLALLGVTDSTISSVSADAYRTKGLGPETFLVSRFLLRDAEPHLKKK